MGKIQLLLFINYQSTIKLFAQNMIKSEENPDHLDKIDEYCDILFVFMCDKILLEEPMIM